MKTDIEMTYVPVFKRIFIRGDKVIGECERTGTWIVIMEIGMVH